ncbi:DUF3237 domain-containing protein [Pantoea sp. MBD-2R]|uniref:DUF3237 domain-containing protein n=1 Tax=unclassified Pantoea TaxID=2630326 RepID=UPI0011BD9725|nr:DUF3237 domain-containing protein [Pantoea sp. CCBC3-3-1]
MKPDLEYSFSVKVNVGKPEIVSNSSEYGKRQLIPVLSGTVSGKLNGEVMAGGVDSQIVMPDGLCKLSARYALKTDHGPVYIENNGVRRVPEAFRSRLFDEDMRFFSSIPTEELYFRTVPSFEIYDPALAWLTESVFVSTGQRTPDGVTIDFYRLT